MPTMITGVELVQAVKNQTFIRGGDTACAEGVKYDFRLGTRILKAKFGRPRNIDDLQEAFIDPGEMVFSLTEEDLDLPSNIVAELSPKRKMSHSGILVIGGFCIDPGYKGKLLLGLYNFSSTKFPLVVGKKVIAATFYRLDGEEQSELVEILPVNDFPDELVRTMESYSPVAVQSILSTVESLRTEMMALRDEFRSRDEWYRRFETSLDRHDGQIGELIRGLRAEKEARESGQDKLAQTLSSIEKGMSWLRGAAWALGGILTFIILPIVVVWLLRALGLS